MNRTRYLERLRARGMDHSVAAANYRSLAVRAASPYVKRDLLALAADHEECMALAAR
jgi:hypothetical protein